MSLKIGLVSCEPFPPVPDDEEPLRLALRQRGATVTDPAWDDPSVDWGAFALCLLRTTWDYHERYQEFLDWIAYAQTQTRLLHGQDVVAWNTQKRYLRDLERRGVRIAPTVWLARGARADLAAMMAAQGFERGFLKPQVGANAYQTLRFEADAAGLERAQPFLDEVITRDAMMLQPYLASVESVGELSLIFIDGRFTHAVRKVPSAGDYRVQDDFGADDMPLVVEASEIETAAAVVGHAEAIIGESLLYARVDYLLDDEGALVLNELELVEPSLFFRHGPQAADILADGVIARL